MSAIPAFFPKPFHKFVGNPRLFGFLEPYEAQYPVLKTLNNVYNAAPASKWGLSIVPLYGVFVGTPPVEKIDLNTSGSLCATGSVWSVYALMIQPQNAGSRALCAVNAAMAMVNGYNCYRKLSAPASPAAMENTTADRK
jgi:hypothetical protein